jgi:hypothetical protein
MSRYRKIDTRMWGDVRFRELSSPSPSGKYLWMFLLTGPQTSNIPGLFRAGEMALAEELGWSLEGFREAFAEPLSKGLVKADWNARVVWVPNAIKYNRPENPNVVKSWSSTWDEIPECALKIEAYERLKAFTEELGEGFAKAFVKGCGKGMANQEQEQEQDKTSSSELEGSSDQATAPTRKETANSTSREASRLAGLLKAEILRNSPNHKITQAQERRWNHTADLMLRLDHRTPEQIAEVIRWAQHDDFWRTNILSMEKLRKQFDQLSLKMRANGGSAALVKLPDTYISASERIRTERRAQQEVAQ